MMAQALKYEKTLVLQTIQTPEMEYKKAKHSHNQLTEQLAEQMKAAYDITIRDFHVLYPIPQSAMDANDAITENNPGY